MKKFFIGLAVLLAVLIGFCLPIVIQLASWLLSILILYLYYRKKYKNHINFMVEVRICSVLLAVALLVGDLIFYWPMLWESAKQIMTREFNVGTQSILRTLPY